ncbi:MAG: hypothetical protein E6778_18745 [Niallia nealsonii]|nr:hypothetical protein [Niallia nealsonii]
MENKFKVWKILIDAVITLLPFTITYLLFANWLVKGLTNGKKYVDDAYLFTDNFIFYRNIESNGVFTGEHTLSTDTPHYWHEGYRLFLDSFQINTFEIFWIGLLVSIFLIVIGRLLAITIIGKITTNIVKNKKKTR